MTEREFNFDVVVVGAGNAALSAAHAAVERGATVGVLEKAPREERGGNSTLTGHMRFSFDGVDDLLALMGPEHRDDPEVRRRLDEFLPRRTKQELWEEIMKVTEGLADQEMLRVHVEESYPTVLWLHSRGHNWIPAYETATTGNIVRCDGGGLGLQQRNFAILEADPKVTFFYDTTAVQLIDDETGRTVAVRASTPEGVITLNGGAIVLACGGFEANPEMRARYLGARWDNVHNRGVPYNTGDGLRMALALGAMPYGGWSSAHASPNDWAMPTSSLPSSRAASGEGQWTRYLYPYSIMVNVEGKRFVDEADNIRALTYAKMGRSIITQPGGRAFQIIDAKIRERGLVPPSYDQATGERADSLAELAEKLGIDPEGLAATVEAFNAAVPQDATPDPNPYRTDGVRTEGIEIPKSNYAMTIDQPPYEGYAVRCGITFTFGGIKVDPATSQVQHVSGHPMPGLYAAGEMVGGLWYWNYPSGSGMMAGATFGRRAGYAAAAAAQELLAGSVA